MEPIVAYHFKWIDSILALEEVPVSQPVLPAAKKFVDECVISSNLEGPGPWAPGTATEFVSKRWFRIIYGYSESWYQARYGERLRSERWSVFRSAVRIAGTPFEIHVPTTISTPQIEGKTSTLSWPGKVLATENPLDWIVDPPDFTTYDQEELVEAST